MGAHVGWAILSIVAEKMTPKVLGQRANRGRPKSIGARKYPSGGREYMCAIREANVLSDILGNRESAIVQVG